MSQRETNTSRARGSDRAAVLGSPAIGVIDVPGVPKLATGIPGFDHVTMGGLPRGRTTLIIGPAGSAKTVFAGQFLAEGIHRGQPGVFVTFEEPAADLRANLSTLGWDVADWEERDLWRFIDASPVPGTEQVEVGDYNFAGLVARVGHAVDQTAAERVVIDSVGAVFGQFADATMVRSQLHRLASELRRMGLTVVITAESASPSSGVLSRHGIEEFVADNVVILRNSLEDEKRRRTVEVLKLRGAMHRKGEYPFTVLPGQGVVVIPLSGMALDQGSSETRISTGNTVLDEMTTGGFFRDSIVLASGATGTGKTLMVTDLMPGVGNPAEGSCFFASGRAPIQSSANAPAWGPASEPSDATGGFALSPPIPRWHHSRTISSRSRTG